MRQLVSGADIDDIDLTRLEALCVGERDDPEFLNELDVAPQGTGGEAVSISKLQSVQGVNALAAGQQMEFSNQGSYLMDRKVIPLSTVRSRITRAQKLISAQALKYRAPSRHENTLQSPPPNETAAFGFSEIQRLPVR